MSAFWSNFLAMLGLLLSLSYHRPSEAGKHRHTPRSAVSDTLPPCSDKRYTIVRSYPSEQVGRIIRRAHNRWFYMESHTIAGDLLLNACNLPAWAYQQELQVKLTGKLLTHPNLEYANCYAALFELTTLKRAE